MRTRSQRIEDRRLPPDPDQLLITLELCYTIDDMGERIAEKLDKLDELTRAVDTLIGTIKQARRYA